MLRRPRERDVGNGRPSAGHERRLDAVRAVGHAAYLHHDPDLAVLDLAFDSLVDRPDGPRSPVRRLRFAGHGCALDVEVRGDNLLTVDLRVSPAGQVVIESHALGADTPVKTLSSRGHALTSMRPQITSFVVRWQMTTRQPVRSAWTLL